MFNTFGQVICCSYLSHLLAISHSRSAKGKWESPFFFLCCFFYAWFEWIFWNAWDLIQLIEWKEKRKKKQKSETICAPKNAIVAITMLLCVCVAWPIVWLLFWFQLSLCPCLQHSQIHSMRSNNNNNSDETENWWSRENFCYNAKIANIYFFQSKMGNSVHALVYLWMLLNWIRLPRP